MTLDIISIGNLCVTLQTGAAYIRKACEELDILPSARINNVDHFDSADIPRIGALTRQYEETVRKTRNA